MYLEYINETNIHECNKEHDKMNLFETLQNNKHLLEMATVGKTSDNYDIVIYTNDPGKIPHFHYFDDETRGNKFHTCIKLESAEYFHHGDKDDILNLKQRKELFTFLNSPHKRYKNETNWQHLVYLWNDENNSDVEIDENIQMPDYRNL